MIPKRCILNLRRVWSAFLIQALVISAAIAAHGDSTGNVLARFGSEEIQESDLQAFLAAAYSPEERNIALTNNEARARALSTLVDLRLLAAKARKDGFEKQTTFQKARELMEMKILAHIYQERDRDQRLKQVQVTEEEAKKYYEQQTNDFLVPPAFTARQVLVYVKGNLAFPEQGMHEEAAKKKAAEALALLNAGQSWEIVAEQFSDDFHSRRRGGLIREGRFGYFPTEMENALRSQEPGKPGPPVRSAFGYHILQLESRTPDGERERLEQVHDTIIERLTTEKSAAMRQAYMEPLRVEMKLHETGAAALDVSLLVPNAVKEEEVLATLDKVPIRESDFRFFIRDAFRAEQRARLYSQPGMRRTMLKTFLDMRVLEAKARKIGLHLEPRFEAVRNFEEMNLLAEFLQERDKTAPWLLEGDEGAKEAAMKKYMDGLRFELGFSSLPSRSLIQ